MKTRLIFFLLGALIATLLCWFFLPRKNYIVSDPALLRLEQATSDTEIASALQSLCKKRVSSGPLSDQCAKKVFAFLLAKEKKCDLKRKIDTSIRDACGSGKIGDRISSLAGQVYTADYYENGCFAVGHLAAISGNSDLLRKMVLTYFGDCEAEMKGSYVEKFIQHYPKRFFAMPDAWELWQKADGAEWCCDYTDLTIPLIVREAKDSDDAKKMIQNIQETIASEEGSVASKDMKAILNATLQIHKE